MKALGCLLFLAFVAMFSHRAVADGGLCKWEGGPGVDASCKANECPQYGGTAICTQVEIKKPDRGDNPEGYTYSMCDGSLYTSNDVKWCIAAGGTPGTGPDGGAGCDNLPAHVLGNMGQAVDQESLTYTIPDKKVGNPTCDKTTVVDSGWGKKPEHDPGCWSVDPVSVNGINILDRRERTYSGHFTASDGTCSTPWSGTIVVRRDRGVVCPIGYDQRTRPDKSIDCYRLRPCPKCVGDPVEVASGARVQREKDYEFGNATGLGLSRYYYSFGFYRPASSANTSVAAYTDFWRTSFDIRLYEEVTAGGTVVSIVEPTGAISAFDGTGAQLGSDGSGDRLQRGSDGTWMRLRGNGYKDHFNTLGQIVSIASPSGDETLLAYDDQGLLGLVQDSFGRSIGFSYTAGRLTGATLPDGRLVTYGYDDAGRMSSVSYPDGTQRKYEYSAAAQPSLMTALVDEGGMRTEFTYDGNWRASASRAGGVLDESFSYGAASTTYTAGDGSATTTRFAPINGVNRRVGEKVVCPGCSTRESTTTYDSDGNVVQTQDSRGTTTKFTYLAGSNLETSRVEGLDVAGATTADTRQTSTEWNVALRKRSRVLHEANGEPSWTESWTYTPNGAVTSYTRSSGGIDSTTSYDVDAHGRVTREDGPLTNVSDTKSYEYYADSDPCSGCRGSVKVETDAVGQKTTYASYDSSGHLLREVLPNGTVSTWTYDERGRLISSTSALGTDAEQTTRYGFDPAGRPMSTTYPDGTSKTYTRDAAGRLTGQKYPSGAFASFLLDGVGNRTEASFTDGSGVLRLLSRSTFLGDGSLSQTADAYGNTTYYSYDGFGDLAAVISPLGHMRRYAYDTLGRRTSVVDANGGIVTFKYNSEDLLASVVDQDGVTTSYEYDTAGHRTRMSNSAGDDIHDAFDAAGNRVSRTDSSGRTEHISYDGLGRVTSDDVGSGTSTTESTKFVYAGAGLETGQVKSISKTGVSTSYSYDVLGRVVDEVGVVDGSPVMDVGYQYSLGRLRKMTYPSGLELSYTYDQDGNLNAITAGSDILFSNARYGAPGNLIEFTTVGGFSIKRDTDLSGRPVNVSLGSGAQAEAASVYAYDAVGRLTDEMSARVQGSYIYSLGGDRKRSSINSAVLAYDYTPYSHRISAVRDASATSTFAYDGIGAMTSNGELLLSYDDSGRLSATNGVVGEAYKNDGLGRRVWLSGPGGVVRFAYDFSHRLISQRAESGEFMETVFAGSLPVAVVRTSPTGVRESFSVYADVIGAPFALYDIQGRLRWRWVHDAFGVGEPENDPSSIGAVRYGARFPGQTAGSSLGLLYNVFRSYDPTTGRYSQTDPLGQASDLNPYVYAASDPVSNVDPLGLATFSGFQPSQEGLIRGGIDLAEKRLRDCDLTDCNGLDHRDIDRVAKSIANAHYVLSPALPTCGYTVPFFSEVIELAPSAFDYTVCCDLASTIAHEGSHLHGGMRGTEDRSVKVEIRCFGCTQLPKGPDIRPPAL